MSNNMFAGMPSINIPRSRWQNSYNITTSFRHGKLIPIDAIPILPGDSLSFQLKDITRMQTPLAPIFGNIKQHFAAFFVPMRLIWKNTEEFFGANKTSAGFKSTTRKIPVAQHFQCQIGSLAHYLGKPYKDLNETDELKQAFYVASILKERAYYTCWNEYFRAQQITNPVIINLDDSAASSPIGDHVGTWNGDSINIGLPESVFSVSKQFDYFTASTISPQYGAAVELPLGTKADIIVETVDGDPLSANAHTLGFVGDGSNDVNLSNDNASTIVQGSADQLLRVYTDLSTATAAKINDIRYAFAVQKYLERANFAGNYFFGILQVHYGVTSPDSRLQRPEFLGSYEEDILVHQVVSTADTTNNNRMTSVGATGAVSVTASGAVNLFNKAFVEPGFVIVLRWTRQRQVYSQGIMREDAKTDLFEIYTPELCNLGDQATKTKEIYWKAKDSDIFGYQEHWAEYRYRPDRVSGMLDPNGPNALSFWTLANKFTTKPELDDDFILENSDNLARALTTGNLYDEYISDTWCNCVWTREMPVRTMPGLIDHFGVM